jgi:hypothetical protein
MLSVCRVRISISFSSHFPLQICYPVLTILSHLRTLNTYWQELVCFLFHIENIISLMIVVSYPDCVLCLCIGRFN